MLMLLEVKTYSEAASRLGTSEAAVKQTMSRVMLRYSSAKSFCNRIEDWKTKRRKFKKGGRSSSRSAST